MKAFDIEELASWLNVAQTVWLIALSVLLWLRKPGTQAQESVAALQEQTAAQTVALTKTVTDQTHALDLRLRAVETDMKHMPTSDELMRLDGTVRMLSEQTRGMTVSLDALRGQVERISTFLLNQKGP